MILSRGDLGGVVLDMRNNGGGLLQGAVETANLLLPPGNVTVVGSETLKGSINNLSTHDLIVCACHSV